MKRLFVSFFILGALVAPAFTLAQTDSTCTQSEEGGFVSLTCIKNLEFAGNAAQLPAFLNSIYMICIGLAAVIGVLQIMRAGVTWMTAAGSHEAIGNAKNLITQTIIGLILVLAPTIVFSIINPEILSLKIGNLDKLAPGSGTANTEVQNSILWVDTETNFLQSNARCAQQGGLPIPHCQPADGGQPFPAEENSTCEGTLFTVCMKRESTPAAPACDAFKSTVAKSAGNVCDGSKGETRIENSCCSGIANGGVCCGTNIVPVSPENPPPSKIPNDPTKVNEACKPIPDKTIIPFSDDAARLCCEYQDGDGVSCQAVSTPDRQKQYCSCSYDSATR